MSPFLDPQSELTNQYTYDNLHRLSSVLQTRPTDDANEKLVQFRYNAANDLVHVARYADRAGDSLVAETVYEYSPTSDLTHLVHRADDILAEYHWNHDSAGRLIETNSRADGMTEYSYDRRDQLTEVLSEENYDTYAYDANGNRVGADYEHAAGNRLVSDGTYAYEYDNEGNRIRREHLESGVVSEYSYDHRNRLVCVVERDADQPYMDLTMPGPMIRTTQFAYDAFDRRISQHTYSANGDTDEVHFFVYDGPHLLARLDEFGTITNRYLHGAAVDQVLADDQYDPTTGESRVLWPLTDDQGSVRDIATYDAEEAVTSIANHIAYDAFGNVQSESNPAVDHVFGFTGRPFDEDTGLYYNRARYYDPAIGRFISEDPSGYVAGDTNLYRYVGNSPTNLTDPSGLAPPDEDAIRLLQGFLRSNGGQRDLRTHPHFVPEPNMPGGGFVATVPRYRNGRVVGSQASPDWELVRRQRERDRREQVAAEMAQRQVMERAFRRAFQRAQQGTVSFLCADGSTGQMSRNIDPVVAQQLLNSPDGHRVDPSSMHFLGEPYRNGPESLVPSEQELEDRADYEVGRIQVESIGPLAWAKTLFDVLGMIPGAEPFDAISGAISAYEGNYGEVTLTFAAVAPVGGQLAGMSKISDRFRTASAAFADLWRGTDRFKDFMSGAGDALRRFRKHRHDDLVTVYRGMSEEEFEAIQRLGKLSSHAQMNGNVNAVPTFWQKWVSHSVNSSASREPAGIRERKRWRIEALCDGRYQERTNWELSKTYW